MSVSGCSPSARRPPQPGPVEIERPLDLVGAGGQRMLGLPDHRAVGRRAQPHRAGGVAVEAGGQAQVGAGLVGVAAQHAQPVELDRPGVVDQHGPPQPARVPLPVHGFGVLEQAGDVAPAAGAALGVARHLDRHHVVVAETAQGGHVEAVGEEVALRIAEVGAVQPHVRLVEDAVERDPAAPAGRRRGELEAPAVEDRAVAVGQLGMGPPVPGYLDLQPVAVVDARDRCRPDGARRRLRSPATHPRAPRRRRLATAPSRRSGWECRLPPSPIRVYPRARWVSDERRHLPARGGDPVESSRARRVEPTINEAGTDGFAVDGTDAFAIDERPIEGPVVPLRRRAPTTWRRSAGAGWRPSSVRPWQVCSS